ncbi:MAG TPA: hypothetical protein VM425_07090, partial [Myxococcota bacterium]|nr:hypothetical protein [Myxococcota bacterium]
FTGSCGGGTVLHYDGNEWSKMDIVAEGAIFDIWGSSGSDVYAVGKNCCFDETTISMLRCWGEIYHYDGQEWSQVDVGEKEPFYAMDGSSDLDIFVVGGRYDDYDEPSTTVLHFDGKEWTEMDSDFAIPLFDVWVDSAQDVFAVGAYYGDHILIHYDGNEWKEMDTEGINAGYPTGVWGSSRSDVFVVKDGPILHYDGKTWEVMTYETRDLRGVWGSSETDVFAVGMNGRIFHYDGIKWCGTIYGDVKESYETVWVAPNREVFIGGSGGTILRLSCPQ